MIVIDASVVLKWILPHETASEEAAAIRQAHIEGRQPCVSPELLFYEVANVLVSKTRLEIDEVLAGLRLVLSLELPTYPFEAGDYPFAMRLARDHGLSAYDACYVALARKLGCQFVTADRQLYGRVRHLRGMRLLV